MKCPNDNTTLLITDRNGIEIDYCPECRGVWLDRGELDKLVERSGNMSERPRQQERGYEEREHYSDNREYRGSDSHHQKKHKKENFLEDFFDFG